MLQEDRLIDTIDVTVEKICKHLPEGLEIQLCLESGAAWVTLIDEDGRYRPLPDQTDKTITEQLNDALCTANGFCAE